VRERLAARLPERILRAERERDEARAALESLRAAQVTHYCAGCEDGQRTIDELGAQVERLRADAAQAKMTIDQLSAESLDRADMVIERDAEIKVLRAEVEVLRQDADRLGGALTTRNLELLLARRWARAWKSAAKMFFMGWRMATTTVEAQKEMIVRISKYVDALRAARGKEVTHGAAGRVELAGKCH
jgi:chromosome segregation ATPase